MHAIMMIDHERLADDHPCFSAVSAALLDAGIGQTHVFGVARSTTRPHQVEPTIDPLPASMPLRWWNRRQTLSDLIPALERQTADAVYWSGDRAASLAWEVAAILELPLIADAWTIGHVENARRAPFVDTWLARSEAIAEGLRHSVPHGTVITTRPPIDARPPQRLPDMRPSLLVLDPGHAGKNAPELVEAITELTTARPDVEVFMELRGRSAHRWWRILNQHRLLERVSVLDHVGMLAPLAGRASIVLAPDPLASARSIIPTAMCCGAAMAHQATPNN